MDASPVTGPDGGRAVWHGPRWVLDALENALDHGARNTALVAVTGAHGMGRTAALQHLAYRSRARGRRVVYGNARRDAPPSPLGVWGQVLVGLRPRPQADAAPASPDGDRIVDASAAELDAVVESLAEAARVEPLTVILDDVDESTPLAVAVLAHVGQRSVAVPLLVAVSAAVDHGDPELARLAQTIELTAWNADDVARLATDLGRDLTGGDIRELHRRTGGIPAIVRRLLGRSDPLADHLPPDVVSIVADQLATLQSTDRAVVETLAVLDRPTPISTVATIAEVAIAEDDVSALERRGLASRRGDGVSLDASVVADAVCRLLDADAARALHLRAAQALERAGAGPSRIARHLAASGQGRVGVERSLAEQRAGKMAIRGGEFAAAIAHLEQALAHLDSLDPSHSAVAGDIEFDLIDALSMGRQITIAERRLLDLAARADDVDTQQRVLATYCRLRWREEPNRSVLHSGRLRALARAWERDDDRSRVATLLALVTADEIDGLTPATIELAEAAVALAAGAPDRIAECHLAVRRALVVHHNSLRDRRQHARTALRAAIEAEDPEVECRARRHLIADAWAAGDRPNALRLSAESARTTSMSTSLIEHTALFDASRAAVEGRYDDASRALAEARAQLQRVGVESEVLAYIDVVYAWDRGTLPAQLRQYESVLATVADPTLRAGLALAALLDGQPAAARRHLDAAIDSFLGAPVGVAWVVGTAVAAEVAAAIDHPSCPELFERLVPYREQCVVPAAAAVPCLGSIDRVLSLLCLATGQVTRAVSFAESALALDQSMMARPWVARSLATLAAALEAAGRSGRAEREQALELAAAIGMDPDVLVLRSVHPHDPPAPPGPATDQLAAATPRVARLVPRGSKWLVGLDDDTHVVNGRVGLRYLHRLVADAGREWHVLDLTDATGHRRAQGNATGPVIDDEARRRYQQRHADLSAQLSAHEDAFDEEARAAVERELEALEDEVVRAYGLGGRTRQLDDPAERARVNVQRAVQRAIDQIAAASPPLGDHLRLHVRTGRFCSYTPDPGSIRWVLGDGE